MFISQAISGTYLNHHRLCHNQKQTKYECSQCDIQFKNVLGDHVSNAISKTNRALHCIRQIKQFFKPRDLGQLVTSNVYSILYYNSEVWNIPSLNHRLKQLLLFTSASTLTICTPTCHARMLYLELHAINNRATPSQMCSYKLALLLHELINFEIPCIDWLDANFQQNFDMKTNMFNFHNTYNYKKAITYYATDFHQLMSKSILNR